MEVQNANFPSRFFARNRAISARNRVELELLCKKPITKKVPMRVIQPNCRVQFTAADIDFIVSNLERKTGDSDCVTRLLSDPDSRDAILDDEKLFRALLENRGCLT